MPHSDRHLQVLNLHLEVLSVSDKEGGFTVDNFLEFKQIVNSAGTKHCSQVIVLQISGWNKPNLYTC